MALWKKILILLGVVIGFTLIGGLLMIIVLFASGNGAQFISQGEFTFLFRNGDYELAKLVLFINHLSSFILSAVALGYIFTRKSFLEYAPVKFKIDLSLLLKLILLLMLCYPMAGAFAAMISKLDLPSWMDKLSDENIDVMKGLLAMSGPLDLITNLLVIGIMPGIGEEMLFRGVIQNELQKHMKNAYLPLIIASFIFAAIHLEPTGLITKFIIGCVLGYAYYLTKNLLYPMIIHALNNGLQVLILYFSGSSTDFGKEDVNMTMGQAVMTLIFIPFIYFLIKHVNNQYGSSIEN